MRYVRCLFFFPLLMHCSNDVFTGGDGGDDASPSDSAPQNDVSVTDGGGSSDAQAGCSADGSKISDCTNCTAVACCVTTNNAKCTSGACTGFQLDCQSPDSCPTIPEDDAGSACCLSGASLTNALQCPRSISGTSGSALCSASTLNCTGLKLCTIDSQCPSHHCSTATFELDPSASIGVCDL